MRTVVFTADDLMPILTIWHANTGELWSPVISREIPFQVLIVRWGGTEGIRREKRVYCTGLPFNRTELDINLLVSNFLESLGFRTSLPQWDGSALADCIAAGESEDAAI